MAATDYLGLTPEQLLGAEVMSASKRAEPVATTPAAVTVITQEDIARSGVTSIADALRMAPGVEVAQQDANTWAISIRGFNNASANKLLVMIDGRTVYNPLFAGTYWELQDMPLEDIERIEVIRGPGGALWGANAVNGVINVITKNAKDTQGALVKAGAGSHEKGFAAGRYGGSSESGVYYRAYAKTADYGSFNRASGGDAHDEWQSRRSGFRVDWDKDSRNQLTFHGDIYHVESGQLNQSFSLSAPYSLTMPEMIESKGANILGLWKHENADASSFSLQSYVDYTERNQVLIADKRVIYDLEAQYNLKPLGRHEVIAGASYRLVDDELGSSALIAFNPANTSNNIFGVFAQDKITLSPDTWFLTLGSKLEHNDYTGFEFQPNARLEWLPGRDQAVWAAVSRAVRTPSRVERDLNITNLVVPPGALFGANPTEVTLTANKGFQAEELLAYDLGYRTKITPDVALDTAAFINDYKNLSSFAAGTFAAGINNGVDPIHNVLPLIEVNGMTAEAYGAEAAATWEARKDWKLSASYTFLDLFLHAAPVFGLNQDTPEHQSPMHQAGLRSSWNISDRWTLDTSLYYVGALSAFDVPAYLRADANLGWQANDRIRLNLVGQNLLHAEHREFQSTTAVNAARIPRSVYGKITCQF
jgi:iron complex outermembrane receptor protein